MPKASNYDRENDPIVKRMWDAESTDADIAKRIGYSVRTVLRVRHRLRLLARETPAEHVTDDTLREFAEQCLTWAEIAERTGLTHRTVQERMSRLNIGSINHVVAIPAIDPNNPLCLPVAVRVASGRTHRRK